MDIFDSSILESLDRINKEKLKEGLYLASINQKLGFDKEYLSEFVLFYYT